MSCGNEMKMKKRRLCYIGCPLESESLRVAYELSDYLLIFCCNLEQNVRMAAVGFEPTPPKRLVP